jgi:hypothetical protein
MKDIDNVLGTKYLNAVDPVTAGLEAVGKVADLEGKVVTSVTKPDLGKFVAQRCGRKTFGYTFSKSKRDDFKKCAQNATDDWNKQYNPTSTITNLTNAGDTNKSLSEQQSSNTNKILIGLGIVVVGLVAYMAYKK